MKCGGHRVHARELLSSLSRVLGELLDGLRPHEALCFSSETQSQALAAANQGNVDDMAFISIGCFSLKDFNSRLPSLPPLPVPPAHLFPSPSLLPALSNA